MNSLSPPPLADVFVDPGDFLRGQQVGLALGERWAKPYRRQRPHRLRDQRRHHVEVLDGSAPLLFLGDLQSPELRQLPDVVADA